MVWPMDVWIYELSDSIDADELVFAHADTEFCSRFDGVDAVPRFHSLDESFLAFVWRRIDRVDAGLVKGDRVKGGEDADIGHFGLGGMGIAIAIDGKAIGDTDISQVPAADVI